MATRIPVLGTSLILLLAGLPASPARGQEERPDDVVGTITRVSGTEITVKSNAGGEVRVRVSPRTQVSFRDAGDRSNFPNPTIDDLREGLGVRFPPGSSTLDHIVVHYVPSGMTRANRPARAESRSEPREEPRGEARGEGRQIKARLQSVGRREIEVDVAGRARTYALDPQGIASRFRSGDLVVLTVDGRGNNEAVTRIEAAESRGTVTRVDTRSRTISIRVDNREESYQIEDRQLLEDVQQGDRVRFDVEERPGGRRVITAISRER